MGNLNFGKIPEDLKDESYDLIPEGVYCAKVKSADLRTVAINPNNEYVAVTYEIVNGEYKGRLVFTNYNTKNTNEKAQMIGIRNIQLLAKHGGLQVLNETESLVGLEVDIEVCIRKGTNGYKDKNDVKKTFVFNSSSGSERASTEKTATGSPWSSGGWGN